MRTPKRSATGSGLAALALTGLGLGLVNAVGTAPAAADPVSATLNYRCTYPLIGARDLTVKILSDLPKEIGVNQTLPDVWVQTQDTIGADTTEGLQAIGARTLEGKAIAKVALHAPEFEGGVLDIPNVTQVLEKVQVPSSGAFDIRSIGRVIAPTFSQEETVTVKINDLELSVTPKKADGSPTGMGTFKVPCVQKPGQDNTLATVRVVNRDVTNPPPPNPYPPSWPLTTDPTSLGQGYPVTKLHYDLNLKGSSFIKNANGTLPIIGEIGVDVHGATGAINGPLTLNPAKGEFRILGFLPVTSDISFQQVGETTGTYANGQIRTTSKMYVRFANFKVFGGVPIAGGADCATSQPITVDMNSAEGVLFNPYKGGSYNAPNYTLPPLNDKCGALGGIVSVFAQGAGNTITAALSPK